MKIKEKQIFSIPKEKRYKAACIVKDRLAGQQPIFKEDPELFDFADKA